MQAVRLEYSTLFVRVLSYLEVQIKSRELEHGHSLGIPNEIQYFFYYLPLSTLQEVDGPLIVFLPQPPPSSLLLLQLLCVVRSHWDEQAIRALS